MWLCNTSVCLIAGGVITLAFAYYFYTPLPEFAGEPWLLRSYIFAFNTANYAVSLIFVEEKIKMSPFKRLENIMRSGMSTLETILHHKNSYS